MNNEFSVNSGEVEACHGEGILRAGAIGSCVVVTAHDPGARVGGMAHVMLPGGSRDPDSSDRTRYAKEAIQELMRKMMAQGACEARLRVCLVGGGNVLGPEHYSPGPDIVRSVAEILGRMHLEPVATEVGGGQRRSCLLDVASGRVTYTVGDSRSMTLWDSGPEESNS
jgi:chemotaxis protein CheD